MKITVRLTLALLFVAAVVAVGFSSYQVHAEKERLTTELERKTVILAESLQESVRPLLQANSSGPMNRIVERFGNRERLKGVAVYDTHGAVVASSRSLVPKSLDLLPQVMSAVADKRPVSTLVRVEGEKLYTYILPLGEGETIGALGLFYDASYIDVRLWSIWKNNLLRFFTLSLLIVIITLITVRWSITGPIARAADWMKELRTGKTRPQTDTFFKGDVLAPLITEAVRLAKSLAAARARAEEEARLRVSSGSLWTAQRLKEHMRIELEGKKLFLVSNREPYMHIKDGGSFKCIVPAGGLVTALDPVMRICDGVWIAHGSGDADKETAGTDDRLRVPPEQPSYTLRRVWLTKEEENGYYYGFSNEGIWPLCHITHTRPDFRLDDWVSYQKVNEKFAEVLLSEIAGEDSPLIFVQDYHLALLPLLVKERRPDARISLFWHIPWPNPEAYGICPWHREILMGMLGADIIGFHIQFHCNNFLDTVDRFLESQIDWEQFSVNRRGHKTIIKPFPISVAYDTVSEYNEASKSKELKKGIISATGVETEYLGVGVDRIDYTKGIPERMRAIERFFEKYPEFTGRFTFVELGAPSRTHIKRYRELTAELDEMVDRINWRYRSKSWKPVVFLKAHHGHEEIKTFYRFADVCMVTSLHDGMNLVAKEFIAAKEDDEGVLILSRFAGASRELKDALIVNPYDIEEMADAIHMSLTMDRMEKTARMARMRATVKEHNIYLWAGSLISSLARLRPPEEPDGNAGRKE